MFSPFDILAGPTVTRLVQDPLAVLFLDNRQYFPPVTVKQGLTVFSIVHDKVVCETFIALNFHW